MKIKFVSIVLFAAMLSTLLSGFGAFAGDDYSGRMYFINKLPSGVTIDVDGYIDPIWENVEPQPITRYDDMAYEYTETTGTLRIVWNDNGFYALVEVDKKGEPVYTECDDPSFLNACNSIDCVQLAFSGNINGYGTHAGRSDFAFNGGACPDFDGNKNLVGWWYAYGGDRCEAVAKQTADDKYVVEYFFSWVRPNDTNVYGPQGIHGGDNGNTTNCSIIMLDVMIHVQSDDGTGETGGTSDGHTSVVCYNMYPYASLDNTANYAYVFLTNDEVEYDGMPGDCNDDGEIDLKDATLLLKYLADWEVEINLKNANVNGDGLVDLKDETLMLKYLAEWDVEFVPEGDDTNVKPDVSKFLNVTVLDTGTDVYTPTGNYAYRYGPSIITYDDGSIDAWFAAPGTDGEWDWITYQHFDSKTQKWSNEVSALQPTGDSMDWLSCCDPGAIYFGGYYYLGYTSTIDDTLTGVRNNVYVARSENPDGPYEKWNGNGWGGKPQPIIYYDGDATKFGAGEPSFVELNGTLYIYYTWKSANISSQDINQTRVAVADATNENWPATIEYKGIAITATTMAQDSADVKYIDDYGKFIAICTDNRMTTNSRICVYESNDGFTFKRVNELRSNLMSNLHNAGISSGPNGHISLEDKIYIGYAYGQNWATWSTRFHQIQISLSDEADFSDSNNASVNKDVGIVAAPSDLWTVGITAIPHSYEYKVSSGPFNIRVYWKDTVSKLHSTNVSRVRFYGYDTNIISINSSVCTPLKPGDTVVIAEYDGRTIDIPVSIKPESIQLNLENPDVISFEPMKETYTISLSDCEKIQVRGMAIYEDLSWNEIYRQSSGVSYNVVNSSIVDINENGIMKGKKVGTTTVTVTADSCSFAVTVNVVE